MERVGIGRRCDDLEIDQAVEDRLTVRENLSRVVVARGVGERQEAVLGADTTDAGKGSTCVGHELRVGHGRRLCAVQRVKHYGRPCDRVVGIDCSRIQHRDGGGGVPEEGIGRVRVLREPTLDGFYLARAKARERDRSGSCEDVGVDGNLNLKFLLVKDDRHEEFVGVEIHVVGDGHATVDHTQLFDLKGRNIELGRRGGGSRAVVQPEGGRRGKGTSDLNLLGKGVRGEWDVEAIRTWHTPDGDDDVGILIDGEVTRPRSAIRDVQANRRAAELEESLSLGLGANLAENLRKELLTTHKVLRTPPDTKGNLLNRRIRGEILILSYEA